MIKETYLAILKKMRELHPEAEFIVVTRTAHSVLAPSWELLNEAKSTNMTFAEYSRRYIKEISERRAARLELTRLARLSREKDVYLVCYEKDPARCHRSILLKIIKGEITLD